MSEQKQNTNDNLDTSKAGEATEATTATEASAASKTAEDAKAKDANKIGEEAKNAEATSDASKNDTPEKSPKKPKSRKKSIVIGVVGVVIVLCAGIGIWHDQPSFCNALCHTPMDGYLTTYESKLDSPSTDKWGNEVENASSMLAPVHAKQNISCVGCHVPTIGEQVSEGLSWISGNYGVVQTNDLRFVPEEKSLSELTAARGIAGEQFCLNSGCHTTSSGTAMTRDDLVEKTSYMKYNVHTQPHGEVACSDCHKAHRASTVTCSQCHTEATVPDGWINASDAEKLEPVNVN